MIRTSRTGVDDQKWVGKSMGIKQKRMAEAGKCENKKIKKRRSDQEHQNPVLLKSEADRMKF
jgi:hypothetical protein